MKNSKSSQSYPFDGPTLDCLTLHLDEAQASIFPFTLPIIKNLAKVVFPTQVTFFVGENGSGKSTILEAIATKADFGSEGGSKNIQFKTSEEKTYSAAQQLAEYIALSWRQKPRDGYFFRAETFYNVANYLDYLERTSGGGAYIPYGGKSLHEQSHGESFLSFFTHRVGSGGFLSLDEPEAALSPQRQLALLSIMHETCKNPATQFIIATHSPLLLAYPNATIYSCDDGVLKKMRYEETQHYQITKRFLDNPEGFMRHLFEEYKFF